MDIKQSFIEFIQAECSKEKVLSISIQNLSSNRTGQNIIWIRQKRLEQQYFNSYLRYRYFRQFWDFQLKQFVAEISLQQEFKEQVNYWYSMVQSLEIINQR